MTIIQNTKELPWCRMRAYRVADEAEARKIAGDKKAYLFEQVIGALYLFVEE